AGITTEVLAQGTDEGQAAPSDSAPEKGRIRHSRARLVSRRAETAVAGYVDRAGREGNADFPLGRRTVGDQKAPGTARQFRVSPVGSADFILMDQTVECSDALRTGTGGQEIRQPLGDSLKFRSEFIVILFAAAIFLGCIVSPPSLMDDVDAVQAQIARNMLQSGDWVTARLDGVIYLEKAPLIYWAIALSYKIFGVHDWAARIPIALSAVALCCLTAAVGIWAFGKRAGFYAGLIMATCVGLFLFTRILIPDVMLTFTVALAMWALLRALDEDEPHPRFWAAVLAVSLGLGLLLKSLIGIVFPIAAGVIYLFVTRQLFSAAAWRRLHPFSGAFLVLLVAAPWHVLAALRNPPYFDFTLHSGPGQYHGFFWFFFINEQLLRFLNLRYPRDYDTVPRLYFWL